MRVSWMLMLGLSAVGLGQGVAATRPGACRRVVVEGEVLAGQGFERVLGSGLKVGLEPIAEGWAIRIVPSNAPRGPHDNAELATPPYQSLSPLIVSTGLGFRAQDAVGWNPRRFRFAANPTAYTALLGLYGRITATRTPVPADEAELGRLVVMAPEGQLEIVDARLIPGTADQVPAAADVASHFGTTAHQVDQPTSGPGLPLGKLEWIRFRFLLNLPVGMMVDRGLKVVPRPCTPH